MEHEEIQRTRDKRAAYIPVSDVIGEPEERSFASRSGVWQWDNHSVAHSYFVTPDLEATLSAWVCPAIPQGVRPFVLVTGVGAHDATVFAHSRYATPPVEPGFVRTYPEVDRHADELSKADPVRLLVEGLQASIRSSAPFARQTAGAIGQLSDAAASDILLLALRQALSAMAGLLKEAGIKARHIDDGPSFEPTFSQIFHRNLPPLPLDAAIGIERALVAQLRRQLVGQTIKADLGELRSVAGRLLLSLRSIERPSLGPRVAGFVKATPL